MQSVLESILVPCPNVTFGCTKNSSYGKELTHEKECNVAPCSCPVEDCDYIGSYKDLYDHYDLTQLKRFTLDYFSCGNSFNLPMKISDKKIVIRMEDTKRLLFAVQCFKEPCGVYVTVSCIAPFTREVGAFSYYFSYAVDGNVMSYVSTEMKRVLEVSSQVPKKNFMWIPHCLLRDDGWLNIVLCIKISENDQQNM
ncbi:hypothetical protein ARALYDRAFT_916589 [Arabidopsis lyrata subsp. lyrata]|uniref:SIAH-type domain-containing protein n=2 Tax=Arabidopsis lyrata subsp. lyrata TaxID=81972 RepID=D7MK79_ARALL|nr:hypothetical protein ARALYDRAFT_916589 [Arabidopsis lyrata subsp. lyrata]